MKNKQITLIILLFPFAISFINCKSEKIINVPPTITSSPLKYGTLSGTIRDSVKFAPVNGAEIYINNLRVVSDSLGYYEFKQLIYAKYKILITKPGFETANNEINISGKVKQDFLLNPVPDSNEQKPSALPSITGSNQSPFPISSPTVKPSVLEPFPSIPPTVIPSPLNN